MKQLKFFLFAFLVSVSAQAYMGTHATEATLKFEAVLEIETFVEPDDEQMQQHLKDHEEYLFGPMMNNPVKAGPKGDGKFHVLYIEPAGKNLRIHYTYEGTIVLESGPRTHYPVLLPINPEAMWRKTSAIKPYNPCTEKDDQGKDDFSYFWSPELPGCGVLIQEGEDYQVIQAQVVRKPNTEHSRPQYEDMPDARGNIHISLLMGMDASWKNPNPVESAKDRSNDDLNAKNYREIRRRLKRLGFTARKLTHEEIRKVIPVDTRPLPYVEEYERSYNGNRAKKIGVTLFFGKSDISEASWGFDYYLKRGWEKSAVTIYDGHSGLGTNLVIPMLERKMGVRFNIPKERYQIFYANSCSSYAYYNKSFFDRKKSLKDPYGTKGLDVITAGLPTPFEGGVETDMSLIQAIHNWAERGTMTGYKELMRRLENDNLAGVNGDEDNPTTN